MFARWVLAFIFVPSALGLCQTRCGSFELPVSAIKADGEMLNGLARVDFHAHAGRKQLAVKSLTLDYGPRRIVVVVDTSRKLSLEARRAERFMVAEILAVTRPQDAVAFVAARGLERTIRFGEDHAGFPESLEQAPAKSNDRRGMLDAVLQAIELFGEPEPGDAIVVIAHDLDNSNTNARTISRLLATRRIRMFGLALGPVMTQNVAWSGGENKYGATLPYALAAYDGGDEDFYPLTRDSGGLVIGVMNPDVYRSYKLDDPAFESTVRKKARMLMGLAENYYRMRLDTNSDGALRLDISNGVHKIEPGMLLLYPHQLPICKK